ncbi:MAG: NAD-dependent deacylase [Halioglobus sp.]|nr:NAD-dependent deacylase [Halioglobus sp.]
MSNFRDRKIHRVVILTGAGISAESGLATFRDSDGLWEHHDPMEIATPEAFSRDPALVFRFYNARRRQLVETLPNTAHKALAQLQMSFPGEVYLVTQNVDDLHERGGSKQVCHMHGELRSALCTSCRAVLGFEEDMSADTTCSACGAHGTLRPDIVWFGEMPYHMDEIGRYIQTCDLFIAIGTSGAVYPAAGFVGEASLAGAMTVEVNKETSKVSRSFDEQRQGIATVEVPALVEELLAG